MFETAGNLEPEEIHEPEEDIQPAANIPPHDDDQEKYHISQKAKGPGKGKKSLTGAKLRQKVSTPNV